MWWELVPYFLIGCLGGCAILVFLRLVKVERNRVVQEKRLKEAQEDDQCPR